MKVIYHGEEIELEDTLIPGKKELDVLTDDNDLDITQQYDFKSILNSNFGDDDDESL